MPLQHLHVWLWGIGAGTAACAEERMFTSSTGDAAISPRHEGMGSCTSITRGIDRSQSDVHTVWSTLLWRAEHHAENSRNRGAAAAMLFLVLGIAAQWITNDFCPLEQLPGKLNFTELAMLTCLGYLLEGCLNPWWQRELDAKLAASNCSPSVSGSIRLLLDICVFTPLCCELYLLSEHVVVEGHWREYWVSAAVILYELFHVRLLDAATLEAALNRPIDVTSELLGEVSSSGAWDAVRAVFARAVPPALRPLVRRLAEATGWTILEAVP
eukprot:jgi/Ulvmu1/12836/UM098_0018.1